MEHQVNPEQWISQYGDYLFTLAMLKTNHRETAEDLVQETFLSAVKNLSDFKKKSSEKTWLVSILNNKIIDFYRKRDIFRNVSIRLSETEESFYNSFFQVDEFSSAHWKAGSLPVDWEIEDDNDGVREGFYEIFGVCIRRMPAKLASVFLAKYVDEKESKLICKEFSISTSNFWVIIHRAKLLIRKCLEKNWKS